MIKEFKEVIDDLSQGIETIKTTWENIRELNPDFEQVSEEEWRSKEALCWLHGGTKFQETVELEQWLYFYAKGSETADSLASKYHDEWGEYIREEGVYLDFKQSNLIATKEGESLLDYIQRCATLIEDNGWGGKKSKRAFKSFLAYLRKFNKEEEIAFIEHIFPEKMDLHYGRIIRVIRPQVYSIPHQIAGDIVKELAYKCAYGRPNAQLKAAEALGLAWLCLTASRIRHPRSLEMVHGMEKEDLILGGEYPELLIPSIFGKQKIRISCRVARFLKSLIDIPSEKPRKTILQSSLHDLRRPLNDAIHKANLPEELGEITFLTFISSPHHFGEHIRYIPKVAQNQ